MSENSDPQNDQQTHDLRHDTPGDLGWENPDYEQPADQDNGREPATIELPAKRRGSRRRDTTHAPSGYMQRRAPWVPVAAALLAACIGAAVALVLVSPAVNPQPPRRLTAVRPCKPSPHNDAVHDHVRVPKRRAPAAIGRRRSAAPSITQARATVAPELPPPRPSIDTEPVPGPQPEAAQQPDDDGQTQGGPFSP